VRGHKLIQGQARPEAPEYAAQLRPARDLNSTNDDLKRLRRGKCGLCEEISPAG